MVQIKGKWKGMLICKISLDNEDNTILTKKTDKMKLF